MIFELIFMVQMLPNPDHSDRFNPCIVRRGKSKQPYFVESATDIAPGSATFPVASVGVPPGYPPFRLRFWDQSILPQFAFNISDFEQRGHNLS
jgi:hypothetical protein